MTVLVSIDGNGVATLTLNRPDKSNAYDQDMLEALAGHVARLGADPATRVLVLRGEGKHFCAGAQVGAAPKTEKKTSLPAFCHELDSCPKPTVALVQGGCIGGGLAFAACCDSVIATHDAFFALPETRLGFAPRPLVPFLLRAMGARALRRYLVSGERFTAETALRLGLVHELCDADMKDQALAKLLGELLQAAPGAASATKAEIARLAGMPVTRELLDGLQRDFEANMDTAESREGRAAFRDKRKPGWAPK
jgi:methylglutaconyl-CoA hydratase